MKPEDIPRDDETGELCESCQNIGALCTKHDPHPKLVGPLEKQQRSKVWKGPYIEALRRGYTKKSAAGLANVSENTVYREARIDPEFADEVEQAYNYGTSLLEDKARDRINDPDKPSDKVLIHMLGVRGVATKKHVEVSGPDGGPIQHSTINVDLLPLDLKLKLLEALESADESRMLAAASDVIDAELVEVEEQE